MKRRGMRGWMGVAALVLFLAGSCDISDNHPISGSIDEFVVNLEADGFIVQEGTLSQIPILKLCSQGWLKSCFGNNAGFPYMAYLLPPAPNQNPSASQAPPVNYEPGNPNNWPANPDFAPPGVSYKLRPDEALVLIGKTPPHARYFSYRSYVGFVENKSEKDYSSVFTTGNDTVGHYHRVFASLGDTRNHMDMATEETPGGHGDDPFDSLAVVLTGADRGIVRRVRGVLQMAGYPASIVNEDIISPSLVHLGLEKGKDTFLFIVRAALWQDEEKGQEYLDNAHQYTRLFRVTPKQAPVLDPYPVPTLRRRGTGVSEYQLIPNAAADLERLRLEILKRHALPEFAYSELGTDIWLPEGFTAIAEDIDVLAENRDTTYLKSHNFRLESDDDFLIVYGVNHEETQKSIYCNFSFYGVELLNGVTGTSSAVFAGSAADYFPAGYDNAKYYYVYKLARKKSSDTEPCVVVPYSTGNPDGKAFGVDNGKDAFLAYRAYVEKETHVGPIHFELIYDRAILFKKK